MHCLQILTQISPEYEQKGTQTARLKQQLSPGPNISTAVVTPVTSLAFYRPHNYKLASASDLNLAAAESS